MCRSRVLPIKARVFLSFCKEVIFFPYFFFKGDMGKNGEDGRRGLQGRRVSIELVFFTWETIVQKTFIVF